MPYLFLYIIKITFLKILEILDRDSRKLSFISETRGIDCSSVPVKILQILVFYYWRSVYVFTILLLAYGMCNVWYLVLSLTILL